MAGATWATNGYNQLTFRGENRDRIPDPEPSYGPMSAQLDKTLNGEGSEAATVQPKDVQVVGSTKSSEVVHGKAKPSRRTPAPQRAIVRDAVDAIPEMPPAALRPKPVAADQMYPPLLDKPARDDEMDEAQIAALNLPDGRTDHHRDLYSEAPAPHVNRRQGGAQLAQPGEPKSDFPWGGSDAAWHVEPDEEWQPGRAASAGADRDEIFTTTGGLADVLGIGSRQLRRLLHDGTVPSPRSWPGPPSRRKWMPDEVEKIRQRFRQK